MPPGGPAFADRREWPRLGRYRVLGELGRGGMGVVYRAIDSALDREVAVKVILDARRAGPSAVERFGREARAVARLRHPSIVAVHEVGNDGGRPFIVMDLIRGATLEELLERGEVAPRRLAGLVRDTARALQHAHERGIVHRDVKPQNVLVDDAGPHLTDFGLARDLDADAKLTGSGQLIGTPAYVAPEQARGEPAGPAADVYALGGVLYRGLAGREPFEGGSLIELIRRVIHEDPEPPRRSDPSVHPDLETIALRCLEKEPERRYGDAAEVAAELTRFLDGEAIRARPIGRRERLARWARRNRALAAMSTVLGVVLAGAVVFGIAFAAWSFDRIREERDRAHARREDALRERGRAEEESARARVAEADARLAADRAAGASARAEGERAKAEAEAKRAEAEAARAERERDRADAERRQADAARERVQLESRAKDGLLARALAEKGERLLAAGRHAGAAAFFVESLAIRERPETRSRLAFALPLLPRVVAAGGRVPALAVALSADGGRLAVGDGRGFVRVFDLATGRLVSRWRPPRTPETGARVVAFGPRGERVASGGFGGWVHVRDVARASTVLDRIVIGRKELIESISFDGDGDGLVVRKGARSQPLRVSLTTPDATIDLLPSPAPDGGVPERSVPVGPGLVATLSTGGDRLSLSGGPAGAARVELADDGAMALQAVGSEIRIFSPFRGRIDAVTWSVREDGSPALSALRAVVPPGVLGAGGIVGVAPDRGSIVWGDRKGRGAWLVDLVRGKVETLEGADLGAAIATWSADGRRLAIIEGSRAGSAFKGGGVRVYDVSGAAPITVATLAGRRSHDGGERETTVALRGDGRRLATADPSGWVEVWDLETGRSISRRKLGARGRMAWRPDGEVMVLCARAGASRVVSPETGEVIKETYSCRAATFSADGTSLAFAEAAPKVWISGAAGDGSFAVDAEVTGLAFSPSADRIAVAFADGSVGTWSSAERTPVDRAAVHDGAATAVAWSPDGRSIAVAGEGGLVRLVRSDGLGEGGVATRHEAAARAVAWSSDGRLLASGGDDGLVRVARLPRSGQGAPELATVLDGHDDDVTSVDFLHGDGGDGGDGGRLASADRSGSWRLWELPPPGRAPLATAVAVDGGAASVAFAPDGARLALGGADGRVRLLDAATLAEVAVLDAGVEAFPPLAHERRPARPPLDVAWSADGARVVTSGPDDRARLWDVARAEVIGETRLGAERDRVRAVAAGPGGEVALCYPSKLFRLEVRDGVLDARELGELDEVVDTWLGGPAVAPDGRLVAVGANRKVEVFDAGTGELLGRVPDGGDPVRRIAIAPGGEMVTGLFDGTLRRWDVGQPAAPKPGPIAVAHAGSVSALAWEPGGRWLVSGGADGRVRFLDAELSPIAAIDLERSVPIDAAVAGGRVAVTTVDGRLLVWEVEALGIVEPVDAIRERVRARARVAVRGLDLSGLGESLRLAAPEDGPR